VTESRLQYLFELSSEVVHLLFWYAVREERRGDTGPFDAILSLTKRESDGSCSHEPLWDLSASKMCTYGSPRAAVLVGPYIHWGQEQSADAQGLIPKWAAGISVAPHTEEVAGSVVDTLLQIAAIPNLRPFIPANAWSWLNDRPSLPPSHRGLLWGCNRDIVRTVRALGGIGILTSYLIVIWPQCIFVDDDGFAEIQISVCENFKGISMGYHRAELIRRLDSILVNKPSRRSGVTLAYPFFPGTTRKYREFKKALQEMDQEANEILNRMPSSFIFLSMLTLMGLHRTLLHLHVCSASPVSVTSRLGRLTFEINRLSCSHSISLLFPCALPVDLEQSQFYLNVHHSGCASRETCYSLFCHVLESPCLRTYILYRPRKTCTIRSASHLYFNGLFIRRISHG